MEGLARTFTGTGGLTDITDLFVCRRGGEMRHAGIVLGCESPEVAQLLLPFIAVVVLLDWDWDLGFWVVGVVG